MPPLSSRATAGGDCARSAGSRCRTRTMIEGGVAVSAHSLRRKCNLAGGGHAGSADPHRRYYAVKIVSRRRRSLWALNRNNLCRATCKANDRHSGILRNQRRCPRQCHRRTGRVCRTAVVLSVAGAKGTWLARVEVSARIVVCPDALSRSRRGSRRGWRGWGSTILTRRVCAVVVTAVAVCLSLVLVVPS